MRNKRIYKRFKLNDLEVNGKMVLFTEVKINDISISGISLKANRRLNIGGDYTLKLEGSKTISIRGTVIWCSLIETRKGSQGDITPIYSAGMQFKDLSTERIKELQNLIKSHKIEGVHVIGGTRLNIRFYIKDPENAILIYPDDYKVKTISLGGMLIECIQNIEIESRIPMEIFIHGHNTLKFVGRVASSQEIEKEDQKKYNIGIVFFDLTEKDREVLTSFIDYCAMNHGEAANEPETTVNNSADEYIPVISRERLDKVEYLFRWHTTMGYYKMLSVKEDASDEQIRQAFFKKVLELHPDKFPNVSDDLKQKINELFTYLNAARSTLLDPKKRMEYDRRPIIRIRG